MTYSILGQNLHDTADRAKVYFADTYGAKHFVCEEVLRPDLPLKPTWQATMNAGYLLCVDVRESPFSNSLYEFVTTVAQRGLPVRLWVAIPSGAANPTFNNELKQAHLSGVGVVQLAADGTAHEFHRPVPLSLFGLKQADIALVPRTRREEIKNAEATFLDGDPVQGCQSICQALESLTRRFAETTYNKGLWRSPKGAKALSAKFFNTDSWANLLQAMETRVDVGQVRSKSSAFSTQAVVRTRGHTDWRNEVSHKPKTLAQLQGRDTRLRTMFESTRALLIEWYEIARPFRLLN